MTERGGWRLATVATLLVVAGIPVLSSCGSGSEDDPREVARIQVSNIDFGRRPTDIGSPRAVNRLANLYATLQRRFKAGDMAGVCAHVSPVLLEQFPSGIPLTASCQRRLAVYRHRLRRKRRPQSRLRATWVRIYDSYGLAGITAVDQQGRRLRVPFLLEGGGWRLQLGSFARPDTLDGILVPPAGPRDG